MTDNTPTEPNSTPAPAPQEPNLGTFEDAAAAAVPPPDNSKAVAAAEFSPEQMKLHESLVSKAIDGAQKKWSEKQDQELLAKGYLTPEQHREAMREEIQVAETKAAARSNITSWMNSEGIDPKSEDGQKVFDEYKDGLAAGIYTDKMLLDQRGIKFLVQAAGLGEVAETFDNAFSTPRSVPMEVKTTNDDGTPVSRADMKRRIQANAQEVIKQYQAARRRGG